ncbi:MSCRAMM family protein [Tardisphaera saccharovorans]
MCVRCGLALVAVVVASLVIFAPLLNLSMAQSSQGFLTTITVTNDHDFRLVNFPCFATIYLSEGQALPGNIKLVGEGGQTVPCQVLGESEYSDGSLKTVTIAFPSNVAPLSTITYHVESGEAPSGENLTLSGRNAYHVENGIFSFGISNGSTGLTNLSIGDVKLSVLSFPAIALTSQAVNYQLLSEDLHVSVVYNGMEMSELEIRGTSPLSYVENITVFKGFPVIFYRVYLSSPGPYRPLMGYLNATDFTGFAYGSSHESLSSITSSGSLFPSEELYSFTGAVPVSLASNATFQYFALGMSFPILAYAYQTPDPAFSALVMPGVNGTYASDLCAALSEGVSVSVAEPAAVLSISYPSSAQAYEPFNVSVDMKFTTDTSSIVLWPHFPNGIIVKKPGATEFIRVIKGSSNESVWTIYANRTGVLSGYFEANGSSVNFTVDVYIQPLLPPAGATIQVTSGGYPVPGLTVTVAGPEGAWTGVTNKTGEIEFTLPLGTYSVKMTKDGVLFGAASLNVFRSGVYKLTAASLELLVRPEFENGLPMLPPNSPLLVLRGLQTNETYYSVASEINGSAEAVFRYLAPGSYKLVGVMWGIQTQPLYINLSHNELIAFRMPGLNSLSFRVVTVDGYPLSNATLQLYGAGGIFLTQATTDAQGRAGVAVPIGNYTYMFRYRGSTVAVGSVRVEGPTSELVNASVSRTTIYVSSIFGPISGAEVRVYSSNGSLVFAGRTNSAGEVMVYLPEGSFTASASSAAYAGSASITAPVLSARVFAGLSASAWLLIFMVVIGWSGYVTLELKSGGRKEEVAKLKSMIQKLNELYDSGEVDFALYNKLNDEYQARLAELTRHEE